jgi:hypothetical protein
VIARPVNFAWSDDLNTILCSGQTDTTGLASCIIYPASPILAGRSYTATFPGTLCSVLCLAVSPGSWLTRVL